MNTYVHTIRCCYYDCSVFLRVLPCSDLNCVGQVILQPFPNMHYGNQETGVVRC